VEDAALHLVGHRGLCGGGVPDRLQGASLQLVHYIRLLRKLSDYAIESTAEDGDFARGKADALYNMMKSFKQRGIHVHGVGFQSHLNRRAAFHFDQSCEGATEERLERIADGMRENMRRLGALGLQVQVSE